PVRTVFIDRGDTLLWRYEVRWAFLPDLVGEFDDGLPGWAVVPRRQRIGGRRGSRRENDHAGERNCHEILCASGFHCSYFCYLSIPKMPMTAFTLAAQASGRRISSSPLPSP